MMSQASLTDANSGPWLRAWLSRWAPVGHCTIALHMGCRLASLAHPEGVGGLNLYGSARPRPRWSPCTD